MKNRTKVDYNTYMSIVINEYDSEKLDEIITLGLESGLALLTIASIITIADAEITLADFLETGLKCLEKWLTSEQNQNDG